MTTEVIQRSGAVWKSRWPSCAPVPNKPTVSVDVKQHFNNNYQSKRRCRELTLENKTPPLFLEQTEPATFWSHVWCATTDLSLLSDGSSAVLGRQVLNMPFFIPPHGKYRSHPCQTLCGWQDVKVQLLIRCHGELRGLTPAFFFPGGLSVYNDLFLAVCMSWVSWSFCLRWPVWQVICLSVYCGLFSWRKMAVSMLWVSWSFCPVTFAANQLVFLSAHHYCPQWPL